MPYIYIEQDITVPGYNSDCDVSVILKSFFDYYDYVFLLVFRSDINQNCRWDLTKSSRITYLPELPSSNLKSCDEIICFVCIFRWDNAISFRSGRSRVFFSNFLTLKLHVKPFCSLMHYVVPLSLSIVASSDTLFPDLSGVGPLLRPWYLEVNPARLHKSLAWGPDREQYKIWYISEKIVSLWQ